MERYTEVALHGRRSLRDFAYMAPWIASGTIDWEVAISATHQYELRPALYNYLWLLDELSGHSIHTEASDELVPLKGSRQRDWGRQLDSLFDTVDPFPLTKNGRCAPV